MRTNTFNQINDFAAQVMKNSSDSYHSLDHVKSVAKNALKFNKILNTNLDQKLLVSVCYLHDIHVIKSKPTLRTFLFEKRILKKILPNILTQFNLSKKDKKIIEQAVYNHPHAFPFHKLNKKRSLYAQLLQDADLVDQFSKHSLSTTDTTIFQKIILSLSFIIQTPTIGAFVIKHFSNHPQASLQVLKSKNAR
jgi:HD superfamily phosphodiesterase